MILQNHWAVSCNYNGEIYGVELKPGKKPDLRIPNLSKEKTAIVHYTILDKGKTKSLKTKYKNFELVISRVGSATAPFKVEQLETISVGSWGNAKILWSERD